MIEDDELRTIFEAEAAESFPVLEQGLLALEQNPGDERRLESVFRVAHSLKGSAAMLGVSAVESLAHQFEEILDRARRGQTPLTSATADQLYGAVDAMKALVEEAVTGKPAGLDLRVVLEELKAPPRPRSRVPAAPVPAAPEPLPSPPPDSGEAQEAARPAASTVRVDTARLDDALEKVGDLVVTSARIALRCGEVEGLRELHESWLREWRAEEPRPEDPRWQRDGLRLAHLGERLEALARSLEDDHARLLSTTEHLREGVQEMRLLPLTGLLNLFPRLVRDLAQLQGKDIELQLGGAETTADRRLIEGLKDPLMHILRNAVDHGVEPPELRRSRGKPGRARIRLEASRSGTTLQLMVRDDGAGLDLEAIRERARERRLLTEEGLAQASPAELAHLIFSPGFSTRQEVSELSGRGTGLDAVRTQIEALGGNVELESVRGRGTTFRLRLPLAVTTTTVLVCREQERLYAIPLASVERILPLEPATLRPVQGRLSLELEGFPIALASLPRILGGRPLEDGRVGVVLREQSQRAGLTTEHLLGVMELMVKPVYESRLVQGASILPDGGICLVLNPSELLRGARRGDVAPIWSVGQGGVSAPRKVLLAEDSPSMRNFERRVLEGAGYRVVATLDGQEAWERLQSEDFDAVVSDIEMPRMNGLELTRRLRALARYAEVPIILVTSLTSDSDRRAGLEAGANAYLTKSSFEAGSLLRCLERFL